MKQQRIDMERLGLTALLLGAAWLVLGFFVLRTAFETPDSTAVARRPGLEQILPERWALFTIDATTKYPLPFRRHGTAWLPVEPSRRNSQFGFDRSMMAPVTEAHELTEKLPATSWRRCDRLLAECLTGMSPIEIGNASNVPRLCGDIAVAKRPIVRWENRFGKTSGTESFDVVLLNVSC